MSTLSKTLFLIGPGFIGGSVLTRLQSERKDLSIAVLVRSDEKGEALRKLGVTPVIGSLDDAEIIRKQAAKSDIIIHSATADHLGSAQAVADAILANSSSSPKKIYIHTSGTDVLVGDAVAKRAPPSTAHTHAFHDSDPADIDARLPDDAPHRPIDGPLRQSIGNPTAERAHNARVAILTPPTIYGFGNGPFNKRSIQVPQLLHAALNAGTAIQVGDGAGLRNAVHIDDLSSAYLTILKYLEETQPGTDEGPYWFVGTQTFSWNDLARTMAKRLHALRALPDDTVATATDHQIDTLLFGQKVTWDDLAYNALATADRLARLGWTRDENLPTLLESVQNFEVEDFLKSRST